MLLVSAGPVSQTVPLQQRGVVPVSPHLKGGRVVLSDHDKSVCGRGCLQALPMPLVLPGSFLLHSLPVSLSCSNGFSEACGKGMVSGARLQRVALVKYLHFNPHVCSSQTIFTAALWGKIGTLTNLVRDLSRSHFQTSLKKKSHALTQMPQIFFFL